MSELEDFLDFLFEKRSGYCYSPVKSKNGEFTQKWFNWPFDRTKVTDWIRSSSIEADVYLSPVLFGEKRLSKSTVKSVGVVWVEFDGQSSIDLKGIAEPNYIIQTSDNTHRHIYWRVSDLVPETAEDINKRITYYLGADSSGWDITQVLRPPETTNHKPGKELPVRVIKSEIGFSCSPADFDGAPSLPEFEVDDITYESLSEPDGILKKYKITSGSLFDRVTKELAVEPNRSSFLFSTGCLLAEAGMEHDEIVSLLYVVDCRIKKFVGRADQLFRLSQIASMALMKLDANTESLLVYSPSEILAHNITLDFYDERRWLHTTGIVIVSGAPSVGKTQFCFDLAMQVATQNEIVGNKFLKPASVVGILSCEMEIHELQYIVSHQEQSEYYKANLRRWNEALRISSPEDGLDLRVLESFIQGIRPNVLIIDSLSEIAEDLTDTKKVRDIIRWCRRMRREYNCAMVLIHHNRKANDTNKKPDKLSDLYGSYLFSAKVDTVLLLWQDEALEKVEELEFVEMKVRYGKKARWKITRSENLTFHKKEQTLTVTTSILGTSNPLMNFGQDES